jgi:hypothetical protein
MLSCLLLVYLLQAGMPVHEFDTFLQEAIHGLILGTLFAGVCSMPARIISFLIGRAYGKYRLV